MRRSNVIAAPGQLHRWELQAFSTWPVYGVSRQKIIAVLIVVFLLGFGADTICQAQAKFVTVHGKEFIAPGGRALLLKGINLGNWLMPEGYMFKFKTANSPR
jgi:hypothetical protein